MKYLFKWLRCQLFHNTYDSVALVFSARGRFVICKCGIMKRG